MAISEMTRYLYPKFINALRRRARNHGDKVSMANLDMRFVQFYESGDRIKVKSPIFGEQTGTVGMTTGWKPAFLLMKRSDSVSSPILLGPGDKIIAVKYKGTRTYVKPREPDIPKKSDFQ